MVRNRTRSTGRMESPLERALQFALLGAVVGVVGAIGLGGSIWVFTGRVFVGLFIAFPVGGFVGGFMVSLFARELVGSLLQRATAGTRGRSRLEYSDAQALAARGRYTDALQLYRDYAAGNPTDPEPLIRGARILRDELRDYRDAVAWLERALRIDRLKPEAEITVVRELVELLERMEEPARTLPHLARIADTYRDTRAGEWAGRRLAQLRTRAWTDIRNDETADLSDYQRSVTGRGGDDDTGRGGDDDTSRGEPGAP